MPLLLQALSKLLQVSCQLTDGEAVFAQSHAKINSYE